jgi:hypothetical protein
VETLIAQYSYLLLAELWKFAALSSEFQEYLVF